MFRGHGLALIAACATLACAGMVRADAAPASDASGALNAASAFSFDSVPAQPVMLDDATPRKPLMAGLDKLGLAKGLDNLGINLYGYVEGSWTLDFSNPPDGPGGHPSKYIGGRTFDIQSNSIILDQVDLTAERTVDLTRKNSTSASASKASTAPTRRCFTPTA